MPKITPRKRNAHAILLNLIGIGFSVIPAAVCTLTYFPLWEMKNPERLMSALTLLLLIISFLPLMRILSSHIKTPSAHVVWGVVFVAFYTLSSIAYEMVVISFFGFLGNLIGAIFFKLAKRSEGE